MRIVIAGGTGQVGAPLAAALDEQGHEVVVTSRARGVDVLTGAGLGEALAGADAVVDVLNTGDLGDGAVGFFRETTERLLDAERRAGVGHHVLLSVVGADRATGHGYTLGKVAQEAAVRRGRVPFSIVRATQFHEHLPALADQLTSGGVVHAPRTLVEPVALQDVVDLLARTVTGAPSRTTVQIAGPQRFALDDLLRELLRARGDSREVRTVEGAVLADALDALVPHGPHLTGGRSWPASARA
ncbi:SDR family oxidoreductase [Kineococcus rhizosphaerae]|uniref:Uncharacterized protein YbjT (DUF2867 family) n=1 Tax=Kineococcus rhizosphaerae TaxID=559628 RepID=A0A2T0QXB9_9ACTN|nr:NAD(P)H-binding protein [Kineococcus rhizosphaerae]PRY10529.1 uncharacterized protein YbjT (DUF2867 family) [Kineococcus rhizosphaerae]